jgi:hypothetical protein
MAILAKGRNGWFTVHDVYPSSRRVEIFSKSKTVRSAPVQFRVDEPTVTDDAVKELVTFFENIVTQLKEAQGALKPKEEKPRVPNEKRRKYVCSKCGSDNVRVDAYAEWDIDAQDWVLAATFDDAICEACAEHNIDASCTLEEVEIVEEEEDSHGRLVGIYAPKTCPYCKRVMDDGLCVCDGATDVQDTKKERGEPWQEPT